MFGKLRPRVDLVISRDRVAATVAETLKSASVDAPFSCGHLIAEDQEILEHAVSILFGTLGINSLRHFPDVQVSVRSEHVYAPERRLIERALIDAGAANVRFAALPDAFPDVEARRAVYVERHRDKR